MEEVVERWLDRLAVSCRPMYWNVLGRFLGFAGVSGEEAVLFQRGEPLSYRFVDLAYEWVEKREPPLRASSMKNQVSVVRSFFMGNRCPLPQDGGRRFHSVRERVQGRLSLEGFRQLLMSCNLTYRATFLMMFQGGMGRGELLYVNEKLADHVWEEVGKGRRLIQLKLPGRKKNRNIRPFYTFVGGDSVDALKQLFHSRGWQRDTVLFRSDSGRPITGKTIQNYFTSHAAQAGLLRRVTPNCAACGGETVRRVLCRQGKSSIVYTCVKCHAKASAKELRWDSPACWASIRYGVNPHELRDLFRTEWHRSRADPDVAEFAMGHTVDPLGYDKIMRDTKYAAAEYRKALPWLNILSDDPRVVDRGEVDDRLVLLENRLREMDRKFALLKGFTLKDAEAE